MYQLCCGVGNSIIPSVSLLLGGLLLGTHRDWDQNQTLLLQDVHDAWYKKTRFYLSIWPFHLSRRNMYPICTPNPIQSDLMVHVVMTYEWRIFTRWLLILMNCTFNGGNSRDMEGFSWWSWTHIVFLLSIKIMCSLSIYTYYYFFTMLC